VKNVEKNGTVNHFKAKLILERKIAKIVLILTDICVALAQNSSIKVSKTYGKFHIFPSSDDGMGSTLSKHGGMSNT
jgi:hypothetical protein